MKVSLAILSLAAATSLAMAQNAPQVGAIAPAVKLTSNEGKAVSLDDYKGKWIVLYFYPKDFTSGCTLEAQNFQRDLSKFEKAGAVILGVSVDSAESHKSFCAKEGLNFKLLADSDGKVSESYGSIKDYNGTRMSARNTFIINPEGKIAKVFNGVKPASHSEEVLQSLEELKKG
ncbi:MAG: peroxiredoxin [Chthoniobacterales bacterium]|nr:MAG: peroxiredoxin [Chthoniobacterales bacterium]